MKWQKLRVVSGYTLALCALIAAIVYLDIDWQSFWFHIGKIPTSAIVLAALLFLAHALINATAFGILLRSLSPGSDVRASAVSWLATVLAKYVPGGVWHFVSRGVLLHRAGATRKSILFSGVLEQIISITAATSIALFLIAKYSASWLVIGILLISILVFSYFVFGLRTKYLPKVNRISFVRACVLYTLSMIPYAAGYVVIVQPDVLLDFLGWLFVATSGGMVAIITPGGLGVREAILAAPTENINGQAVFASAIAARVVIILTETFVSSFAIIYSINRTADISTKQCDKVIQSIGYGVRGPGYPNSHHVQKVFESLETWKHIDSVKWLPENVRLWRVLKNISYPGLILLLRLSFGSFVQLFRTLSNQTRLYYVPYPSIFLLWWCSWIPARFRPIFIVDAYISIYDSAFNDRIRNKKKYNLPSAIIRSIERRALRSAAAIVVDTTANRSWMANEFDKDIGSIHAFPLAFEADPFLKVPKLSEVNKHQDSFTVLFFGTLVPLHGVDVITDAIKLLHDSSHIRFMIIGDGQEARCMEELVQKNVNPNLQWIRDWVDPDQLADHIADAHLSLGVFGGVGKVERVLPWKIYMALAAGRPVLTQTVHSLPADVAPPPLLFTEPTSESLAAAILSASCLTASQLEAYATASRAYFLENLSQSAYSLRWRCLLDGLLESNGDQAC